MCNEIFASALALNLLSGAAQAATVGSFTFDDTAFADTAIIAATTCGTHGPGNWGGVFTTVWDVAALNSHDVVIVSDPDVVPLPTGLPLLFGALGGLVCCAEDASKIFRKG